MATSEKRTLSIEAKVKDQMSSPLSAMTRNVAAFGRAAATAFKIVAGQLLNVKTALLGVATSFLSLSTIKSFGEQADALLKLSESTGDTVENLSLLQASFELAGVRGEGLTTVLRTLLNESRKARDGNEEVAAAFRDVGISLTELQTLGPSQLFEQIAAGLERFNTAQDKAAALSKLLPRQFLDLLPVLGGGLKKFQDSIREAEASGAKVLEGEAKIAERLNDSLTKLGFSIGNVSRALINEFGPSSIAFFETLAKKITGSREGIVTVAEAIGKGLVTAINLAISGLIELVATIESIPGVQLLDATKIDAEIAALDRRRIAIRKSFAAQGDAFSADARKALRPIEEAIDALQRQAGRGLAGAMRDLRTQLTSELDAVRQTITQGSPPVVGDKAAAAIGLPTPEEVVRIQEGIARAMAANPAKAAAAFPSVFAPPKGGGISGLGEDAEKAAEGLAKAAAAAKKLADEIAKVEPPFQGDFFGGFELGAKQALSEWTNFTDAGTEAAKTLITNGLDGITNALTDIVTGTVSGSAAFKALAKSVVSDLQRIITKLVIIEGFELLFGTAKEKGGVVPKMERGGIKRYAGGGLNRNGGIANRPTVLFGEGRTAEAFVPLPDNRSIPVSFVGDGPGGGMHLTFNINALDGKSVEQMLIEKEGTIRAIWENGMAHRTSMRHAVQRAR